MLSQRSTGWCCRDIKCLCPNAGKQAVCLAAVTTESLIQSDTFHGHFGGSVSVHGSTLVAGSEYETHCCLPHPVFVFDHEINRVQGRALQYELWERDDYWATPTELRRSRQRGPARSVTNSRASTVIAMGHSPCP